MNDIAFPTWLSFRYADQDRSLRDSAAALSTARLVRKTKKQGSAAPLFDTSEARSVTIEAMVTSRATQLSTVVLLHVLPVLLLSDIFARLFVRALFGSLRPRGLIGDRVPAVFQWTRNAGRFTSAGAPLLYYCWSAGLPLSMRCS